MWGAIAGAAISLINSEKAGDSAKAGAEGAERGSATTLKMYHETADRLQPWVDRGGNALHRLSVLTGLTGSGVNQYAGQNKTLQQITDEITAKVSADHEKRYGMPLEKSADESGLAGQMAEIRRQAENQFRMQSQPAQGKPADGYGTLMEDFSLKDFAVDPSYNFRMEEGEKALTRGAASRGMAMSTPGLKDLMRFNQGLASTEYGNAWTRDLAEKNNKFNMLMGISQGGQNAAAQVGSAGTAAGSTMANLQTQAGMLSGQSTSMAAGAANQAVQGGLANYMYNDRYQKQMDMFSDVVGSRMPASTGTFGIGGGA